MHPRREHQQARRACATTTTLPSVCEDRPTDRRYERWPRATPITLRRGTGAQRLRRNRRRTRGRGGSAAPTGRRARTHRHISARAPWPTEKAAAPWQMCHTRFKGRSDSRRKGWTRRPAALAAEAEQTNKQLWAQTIMCVAITKVRECVCMDDDEEDDNDDGEEAADSAGALYQLLAIDRRGHRAFQGPTQPLSLLRSLCLPPLAARSRQSRLSSD